MQIRKLERRWACRVFERGPKRCCDRKGEVILAQARRVLLGGRRLMGAGRRSWTSRLVRPAVGRGDRDAGPLPVPLCAAAAATAFPRLELVLHEGRTYQLVEALRHGALDLVFLSLR